MRLTTPWTLFALLIATTTACSSDNSSEVASVILEQQPRNPVIVVMGGFNSCSTDENGDPTPRGYERWNKAATLTARYAQGPERWVRSCFDTSGGLHFITANAPGLVRTASVSDPIPFFQAVQAQTDDSANPVYLVGHSHGGWLAMYTAYYLRSATDVRLLYTVDPISPLHCTPSSYYAAVASPALSPYFLAGCQRAPQDFTVEHRTAINARLADRGWRHYYQVNFVPLHSSDYDDAGRPAHSMDLSPFLNVTTGMHPSWNAHTGIDELSTIWHSVDVSIGMDLGVSN